MASGEGVDEDEDRGLHEGVDDTRHEEQRAEPHGGSHGHPDAVAFEDAEARSGRSRRPANCCRTGSGARGRRRGQGRSRPARVRPRGSREATSGAAGERSARASQGPSRSTSWAKRSRGIARSPMKPGKPRHAPEHELHRQVEKRQAQHARQAGRRGQDVGEREKQHEPGAPASAQDGDQVVDGHRRRGTRPARSRSGFPKAPRRRGCPCAGRRRPARGHPPRPPCRRRAANRPLRRENCLGRPCSSTFVGKDECSVTRRPG